MAIDWDRESTYWINTLSQLKNDIKDSVVFAPKEIDEAVCDVFDSIDFVILLLSCQSYSKEQQRAYEESYKGYVEHYPGGSDAS